MSNKFSNITTTDHKTPKSPGRKGRGEFYDETYQSDEHQELQFANPEDIVIWEETRSTREVLRQDEIEQAKYEAEAIRQIIFENCDTEKKLEIAERRMRIWRARSEGYTLTMMAKVWGVSRSLVNKDWRFVRKAGAKVRSNK